MDIKSLQLGNYWVKTETKWVLPTVQQKAQSRKIRCISLRTVASSTVEVPTAHILLMIELWQEVFRQRI